MSPGTSDQSQHFGLVKPFWSAEKSVQSLSKAGEVAVGVAVYPRLSELLLERNLTIAEVARLIEERFGLALDPGALDQLLGSDSLRNTDLEVAGAAAAVLKVGLDDLFEVRATPTDAEGSPSEKVLEEESGRRLAELFDRQDLGELSIEEKQELEGLITEFGLRLHEKRLAEYADRQGLSTAQAREMSAAQFEDALAWWRHFEADPGQRASLIGRSRRRDKQGSA